MAYNKTTWIDDVTPLDAAHLNNMEDGIEKMHNATINGKLLSSDPSLTADDVGALAASTKIPIVDKKFSSTSDNAQSGKAVAEAVTTEQKRADNVFSNALKGSKSGSVILIDDVSPVTHDMGVKISSNTITDLTAVKVSRCGKNLFGTIGAVKFNGGSSFSVTNNTITVGQSSIYNYASANVLIPQSLIGKTVTISAKSNTSGANVAGLRIQWVATDAAATGDMILGEPDSTGKIAVTGTVPAQPDEVHNNLCLMIYSNSSGTLETDTTYTATYSDIQIELGTTTTDYEPYNGAEYTPNADGTVNGVTSLYPNISLMTDTDGVIIDCEYNKDINKFGDLTEYVKHTDIDQTYSSTSENAQSGKAVAEAVAPKANKTEVDKLKDDITELQTALIGVSDLIGGDA